MFVIFSYQYTVFMLAAFIQWVKLCERLRSTFIMQPVIYLHWAV